MKKTGCWRKTQGLEILKGENLNGEIGRTAVGIDQWGPGELRLLPKEGLEELVKLYQTVERTGRWPSSTLCNIIVLMGKPKGVRGL